MSEPKIRRIDRTANATTGFTRSATAIWRERTPPCRSDDVDRMLAAGDAWRWFFLRVSPQEEFRVVDRLAARGLFAFTPDNVEFRFANKFAQRKSEYQFPAAPGYVAVAMAAGEFPRWVNVLTTEGVLDVMGEFEAPTAIRPRAIEMFWMLRHDAEDYRRFQPTHGEFGPDDAVRILYGPMAGQTGRVEAIDGAQVRIILEVFGGVVNAEVPAMKLAKAEA